MRAQRGHKGREGMNSRAGARDKSAGARVTNDVYSRDGIVLNGRQTPPGIHPVLRANARQAPLNLFICLAAPRPCTREGGKKCQRRGERGEKWSRARLNNGP